MSKTIWTTFNYLEFELPEDAVMECYHQGACDDDVEFWQARLNLNLDRTSMIKELKEYGAWSLEELNAYENHELEQKLIWIAAGNIQDERNVNQ